MPFTPKEAHDQVSQWFADWEFRWPKLAHRDDVELVATPSGYGVKSDGTGKLFDVPRHECLRGRDNYLTAVKQSARAQSGSLLRAVEVPKGWVVGPDRLLRVLRVPKKDCRLIVAGEDDVRLPGFLFVTYLANERLRLAVKVLGPREK